jgi:secondary thiamine-phosphate synthase enzyme
MIDMVVFKEEIPIKTKGEEDIVDITGEVAHAVKNSKLRDGMACVFVSGSTGAVTTIEYEPGLLTDFPRALERLFSKNIEYEHHLRWRDGNGHSHVRAAFIGPSLTVPFSDGRLTLGTWQQIVFIELDIRPRHRKIIVQIIGE